MFITDDTALMAFAERSATSPIIAVDTEFMREKTYFARLCLVQIATESEVVAIDPLAVTSLEPLFPLFQDHGVLKVFHAGTQDLEILYRMMGTPVTPVFDTQVAATVAGFPTQVGYAALIKEFTGITLDKSDTYTDWARRPLTDAQCRYALDDVRHLIPAYHSLVERLSASGRMGWLEADFAHLIDASTYDVDLLELWRRVKRISSLDRRSLAVARELTAWREEEAMRRDLPKRWVLGDESIIEVARRKPLTDDDLRAIRGVAEKTSRSAARGILAAVAKGVAVPDEDLPSFERRKRITKDVDGAVDLMIALVRKRARENGVAMPLIASREDLERLAGGERDGHGLLEGWRRTLVGEELLELLEGRLALSLVNGDLDIVTMCADADSDG